MVFYYPLVIEACLEFKRFLRKYLADYNGKFLITNTTLESVRCGEYVNNSIIDLGEQYNETNSARTVELAKGYKLVYHVDDKYYCLKES